MKKISTVLFSFLFFSTNTFSQISPPPSHPESIECTTDFIIHKFRDKGKRGKIVIGRPIEYSAKPTEGTLWKWEIGKEVDGSFLPQWQLTPIPPSTLSSNGDGIIPVTGLPENNSSLGPTNGTIRVEKEVNSVSKDALSTDTGSNIPEGVEVYFEKDDINPHSNLPNWYHYWEQLIPTTFLEMPGIKLFDPSTCEFNLTRKDFILEVFYNPDPPYNSNNEYNQYGGNHFIIPDNLELYNPTYCDAQSSLGSVGRGYYPNGTRIEINQGCGYQKQDPAFPNDPTLAVRGIHTFLLTVVHEIHHVRLKCELWREGYAAIKDEDLDGYPDAWEMKQAQIDFGFKLMQNDKYQHGYTNLSNASVGTRYEEEKCRQVEALFMRTMFDSSDWSYDPTNTNQGKQWNN